MSTMSFRELVQTQYIAKGVCLMDALIEIRGTSKNPGAGVSISSLRSAYHGTRVTPETATALVVWARDRHGVTLGYAALTSAPKRERSRVDWGERARVSVVRAIEEAGLDPLDVSVQYLEYECGWN